MKGLLSPGLGKFQARFGFHIKVGSKLEIAPSRDEHNDGLKKTTRLFLKIPFFHSLKSDQKVCFSASALEEYDGKIDVKSRVRILDVALGNEVLLDFPHSPAAPSLGRHLFVELVSQVAVFIEVHGPENPVQLKLSGQTKNSCRHLDSG